MVAELQFNDGQEELLALLLLPTLRAEDLDRRGRGVAGGARTKGHHLDLVVDGLHSRSLRGERRGLGAFAGIGPPHQRDYAAADGGADGTAFQHGEISGGVLAFTDGTTAGRLT